MYRFLLSCLAILSVGATMLVATGEGQVFAVGPSLAFALMGVVLLGFAVIRRDLRVGLSLSFVLIVVGFGVLVWRSTEEWVHMAGRADLVLACIGGGAFFLVRSSVRLRPNMGTAVVVLVGFVSVANIVVGFFQVLIEDPSFFPIPGYKRVGYPAGRISGFFNHPNQLGAFLSMAVILFLVHCSASQTKRFWRCCLFLLSGACVVGVVMTGSRALPVILLAAILLVGTVCAIALFKERGKLPGYFKSIIVGGAVVAPIALAFGLYYVTSHRSEGLMGGAVERQLMRDVAIEQFRQSPILGAGAGTYVEYSRRLRSPEWPPYLQDSDPRRAHCDWAQLLGEYGLIGGVLVLSCLSYMVYNCCGLFWARSRRSRLDESVWQVALLGALFFLALHSLIDFPLRSPAVLLLLASIAGVCSGLGRKDRTTIGNVGLCPLVGLIGTGLWLVPWGAGLISAERAVHMSEEPTLAIGAVQRAIQSDSRNTDYYVQLGQLWVSLGERFSAPQVRRSFFLKAQDAYERAIELRPDDFFLVESLAVILDRQGKYEEATPLHLKTMEIGPLFRRSRVNYCLNQDALARKSEDPARIEEVLRLMNTTMNRFGGGDPRLSEALLALRADHKKMLSK